MEKPPVPDPVNLWRISLDRAATEYRARFQTLSTEERARALRFARTCDRESFVMVRSELRELLSPCVATTPSAIRFEYGVAGKPRLAGDSPVRFSVSHSRFLALIAITMGRDVGVDLEFQRSPLPEPSADVFSPDEVHRIRASGDPVISFYDHWTLKEAVLKGLGLGFSVSGARINATPGAVERIQGFAVQGMNVHPRFSAAVAIECGCDEVIPPVLLHDTLR